MFRIAKGVVMEYNNLFRLQDFFCNDNMTGILPQFNRDDLRKGKADDDKIYTQCRNVINGFLNGVITEKGIAVTNKSSAAYPALLFAIRLPRWYKRACLCLYLQADFRNC